MMFVLLYCFLSTSTAMSSGYYISNMSSIILMPNQTTLFHNPYGMISSLAVDVEASVMFWSDVSLVYKGIYSASLTDLKVDTKLVLNPKPIKVLGLALDPVHKNLYWTDEVQSTVEMYSYISKERRTLIFTDVSSPRGIALDISNGILYWNDQKLNSIEKSRLDGSMREVIVKNTKYSNHMVVYQGFLYWLNSDKKTLMSTDYKGLMIKTVAHFKELSENEHLSGLTIDTIAKQFIITTSSRKSLIFYVSTETYDVKEILPNLGSNLYGLTSTLEVIETTNFCENISLSNQLCTTVESKPVILCPSYGGLVLKGNTCSYPSKIVLFTILNHGYIAYTNDLTNLSGKLQKHRDVYFVYKQQSPTALAYDANKQMVYWSHIHPYAIYRCPLNCSRPEVVMSRREGLGLVEGMHFDRENQFLIFSDFGEIVEKDGNVYGWNRIQLLQTSSSFKLFTILEAGKNAKLRAVAYNSRSVFYSDWGQSGRIGSVYTDGTFQKILRSGFDNPNGIFYANSHIYFVDSHYKNKDKNAEFYEMDMNGRITKKFNFDKEMIPVGITLDVNKSYISDWKNNQVVSVSFSKISQITTNTRASLKTDVLIDDVPAIFNLLAVDDTATKKLRPVTCSKICEGICMSTTCLCPSLRLYGITSKCQTIPQNYILFSDMTSIKLLSLDTNVKSATSIVYGDMYNTNILSFTFDPNSNSLYYFSQNEIRKKVNIHDSKAPILVYQINHHITSMAFYKDNLVWVDPLQGLLCRLSLKSIPTSKEIPQSVPKHQVLSSGLNNPRTVKYYNNYIYWSESGVNTKIMKMHVDSQKNVKNVFLDTHIAGFDIKNNNFYFDASQAALIAYNEKQSTLMTCTLDDGIRCKSIKVEVYSEKNILIYSDIKDNSIKTAYSQHQKPITLLGNLVRPGDLYIKYTKPLIKCNNCSVGTCVPLVGERFMCICPKDYIYNEDETKCIDTKDEKYQCKVNEKPYNYLHNLKLSACKTCICKGQGVISHDDIDSLKGFECTTTNCPELDCPVDTRIKKNEDCCEQCPCKPFNHCPKSHTEIFLPPFGDYAIDGYKPQLRLCQGYPKYSKLVREPTNNIIQWKKGVQPKDQIFSVVIKGHIANLTIDSDLCAYKLKLKDVTKPKIKCPHDVTIFSLENEVKNVRWITALATDNVGIKEIKSNPVWGSNFKSGVTKVFYDVIDYSGLSSYCSFNVIINQIPYVNRKGDNNTKKNEINLRRKRETSNADVPTQYTQIPISDLSATSEVRKCWLQRFFNGHLDCNIFNETITETVETRDKLECNVICNEGYKVNEKFNNFYSCYNGTFEPSYPENMNQLQCKNIKSKTLTGILPIDLSSKCKEKLDHEYTRKYLLHSIKIKMSSPLKYSVETQGCQKGNGKRRKRSIEDLTYDIGIGSETHADDVIGNTGILNTKLGEIADKIDKSFITVITNSESTGLQNVYDYAFQEIRFEYKCEKGEVEDVSNTCKVCSVGFYQNDSVCSICYENTYNDIEGAIGCKRCPDGETSPKGSFNKHNCLKKDPVCSSNCKLGLVVGIPVGIILFLLVLLLIIVFCCFYKKKKSFSSNAYPNENSNDLDKRRKDEEDEENERKLHFLHQEQAKSNAHSVGPNGTIHTNSVYDSTY